MKILYLLWALSEVMISRAFRARSSDRQHTDKSSLAIIWITVLPCIFLAKYCSDRRLYPIMNTSAVQYIGAGILIGSIFVRLLIIISLGRFFTTNVTIRQEHRLKTDGFYKYIRHPAYAASLMTFVGFGISLNSWLAVLIVAVPVFFAFYHRIRIEENLLLQHFGQSYQAYKNKTWRLIPFVF